MIIESEETEVVKRIYREYLEGARICTDGEKPESRQHTDSSRKGKMEAGDIEENIVERKIYRRCTPAENLYRGFPFQETGQMALYRSIMWRTATSQLFPVTFICRCRKKWYGVQISTAGRNGRKGFIVASMLCQALLLF